MDIKSFERRLSVHIAHIMRQPACNRRDIALAQLRGMRWLATELRVQGALTLTANAHIQGLTAEEISKLPDNS